MRRDRAEVRVQAISPGAYALTVLYHFEFRGETGWEAFGSGGCSEEEPIVVAMADLTAVAGGTLPEGEYRCISALSESPRWESIWIGADGVIEAEAGTTLRMPD